MIKTWRFEDTGEAYDACQCNDDMKDGDTLICGDTVVGIVGTWPVAVTKTCGKLHQFTDPSAEQLRATIGVLQAIKVADDLGLGLDDGFVPWEVANG